MLRRLNCRKKSFLKILSFSYVLLVVLDPFLGYSNARAESYYKWTYVVSSWYGHNFHGNKTASGEIFDMNSFTCAHKEYPFGTKLKVTNISNYKSIRCLVNDRGPFKTGRELDLSYAAAKMIDLIKQGIGIVRIEYMGSDIRYERGVKDFVDAFDIFKIQSSSFNKFFNAVSLKISLEFNYKFSKQ